MKSYLQGAPELRLGLSEDLVVGRSGGNTYGATVVDDITFHQACNLSDFDRDKVIALQAPDGESVVLNYRISGEFELPFRVFPFVEEIDEGRIDVLVKGKNERNTWPEKMKLTCSFFQKSDTRILSVVLDTHRNAFPPFFL